MNRIACIITAFALGACATAPVPATAQVPAPEAGPRTIFVNATAVVHRAPDRAVIALAVETTGRTAADASSANAERMSEVIEAVRRMGLEDRQIRTSRLELMPQYERTVSRDPVEEPREPRITGYIASNQVTVTVDDVGVVGRIMDAAVAAGANRVSSLQFELRDPDAAYHEAIRLAIQKARREALVIAESLGERLGVAQTVTTSAYSAPPAPMMGDMRMERAQAMPTPVQPGELDVQATVSITFLIGT